MNKKLTFFVILIVLTEISYGQGDALLPLKTDTPPEIDGVLDDLVWTEAPGVTDFKTFSPDFGKDMPQKTVAYMAYDEENLYFAFECFDTEADKIKAAVNARDNIRDDDWICINLDSFNDHQSLYAFYVNPQGIQMDTRFSAGQEDGSVDYVWYSAGILGDDAYRIEIQIPLKSIRFSNKEPVEMSVFFERHISRLRTQGSYPEMDPDKGFAFLMQMQPMIYKGVKHYKLFEVLPAFTYAAKNIHSEGEMQKDIRKPQFSLTGKYGITSQLILDGTINPDFSQVEADAGQVDINLRYKLFYPEKRPFFLEGHENFIVAATKADEHDPVNTLIHTRAIVNPMTGVKLTGKAGERITLATMYSLDRVPDSYDDSKNRLAHFPIFRMKYSLSDDSYLGVVYTGREMDSTFNRAGGIDGQIRVSKSSSILYNGILSSTQDMPGADISNGYMLSAEYSHDNRNINWSLGGKSISSNFYAETGYIKRRGINYVKGLLKPKFYPEAEFIDRIDLELFSKQTQDIDYDIWETVEHIAGWFYFKGSTFVKLKAEYATESFLGEKFFDGGFHGLVSTNFGKKLSSVLLYQRLGAIYYSADPYQGRTNRIMFMTNYKPSDKLHLDLSYTYSDFYDTGAENQVYNYSITRARLTYQMNKYFFVRTITEYNSYRKELLGDFLASFTWIPGTVVYLGYGSVYERVRWDGDEYIADDRFLETTRGFFFKCSYLHRF